MSSVHCLMLWYVECLPTTKKGVYIPKNVQTKRSLPKSYGALAGHPGYAHPADSAVGAAAWICLEQGYSHELRRNIESGHWFALSSASPARAQGLDRGGMEGFRSWAPAACLSPDENGKKAI